MTAVRSSFVVAAVAIGCWMAQRGPLYPSHTHGIVVVTGASSGIGRDAALRLDALGFTVFAGVRKQADADALRAERATLRPLLLDVTDETQCIAAAKQVQQEPMVRTIILVCALSVHARSSPRQLCVACGRSC